jgi:hypothetical protein
MPENNGKTESDNGKVGSDKTDEAAQASNKGMKKGAGQFSRKGQMHGNGRSGSDKG